MKKNTSLVKALSIKERIINLSPIYQKVDLSNEEFNLWCDQRSLCSREDIREYLKLQEISKKDFKVGIKKLSKQDKLILFPYLKNQDWFILNQTILNQEEEPDTVSPECFLFFLRFHLKYCKKQIQSVKSEKIQISKQSYKIYEQFIQKDLLGIALKTLIYDMHEQKKFKKFKGVTSEERFIFHLKKRFKNKKSISLFFEEYPVLCRLLSERVQFHMENFKLFIDGITEALEDISRTFNLKKPYQFSICEVGVSDSHSRGKTVTIFKLNDKKLVFKFKELHIAQQWNQFLQTIEDKSNKSFYKLKRVLYDDYTIEEFVEYKECESHKDVEDFYIRFGEYIAITYFLCGNDFHFENIIAHGSFPVLIDLETLFQNDIPIIDSGDIYQQAGKIKTNSVLSTSLLPVDHNSTRAVPKTSDASLSSKVNNTSAFCGSEDKLPYKVLTIVNWNTDDMRFEYTEHYSEKQKNIPMIGKSNINPFNFKYQVRKGFVSQYNFILKNKDNLKNYIKKIFGKTKCRSLLRSTQQYLDMIEYGLHPSCMKDYLEREKLFENLWAYSFQNKEIISYEIQDLLQNDIPIFFSKSDTTNLQSSNDVEIDCVFMNSSLDRVLKRLENFSVTNRAEQLVWLSTSLGKTNEKICEYKLEGNKKEKLDLIVKTILNRFFTSKNNDDISVYDFVTKDNKEAFSLLSDSFYDGLSGIYIFLLYYEHFFPNFEIRKILNILERKMFDKKNCQLKNLSVYEGTLSILPTLYYKYQLSLHSKYIEKSILILNQVKFHFKEFECRSDWLNGLSGLIRLISGFYKISGNTVFLEFLEFFLRKIDLASINLAGLSHGYSGIVIALQEAIMLSNRFLYLYPMIQECIEQERLLFNGKVWKDKRQNVNFTTQWCHGAVGIGFARLSLLDLQTEDIFLKTELNACIEEVLLKQLNNDCLCHGNMGSILFLHECLESHHVTFKMKSEIKKKIDNFYCSFEHCKIEGMDEYPKLGLMTGISGIGYGFLKLFKKEVPNILILN